MGNYLFSVMSEPTPVPLDVERANSFTPYRKPAFVFFGTAATFGTYIGIKALAPNFITKYGRTAFASLLTGVFVGAGSLAAFSYWNKHPYVQEQPKKSSL